MKYMISLLTGITCLLAANIATAAPVMLTATHAVISQAASTMDTTAILQITVVNNSGISLNNVTLEIIEPNLAAEPGINVLSLPTLVSGAQVSIPWNIVAMFPLETGQQLQLLGKSLDANGQWVQFQVTSVSGVIQ